MAYRFLLCIALIGASEGGQYIWKERAHLNTVGDEVMLLIPDPVAKTIETVTGLHATVETNGCKPGIIAPFFGDLGQHPVVTPINTTVYSVDWQDVSSDASPNTILLKSASDCDSKIKLVTTFSTYEVHTYYGNTQLLPGNQVKYSVGYGDGLIVTSLLINSTSEPCPFNFTKLLLVGHSGSTVGYCNTEDSHCLFLSNDVNLHDRISLARHNNLVIENNGGCPITIHNVEVIYKPGDSLPIILIAVISASVVACFLGVCFYRRRVSRRKTRENRGESADSLLGSPSSSPVSTKSPQSPIAIDDHQL